MAVQAHADEAQPAADSSAAGDEQAAATTAAAPAVAPAASPWRGELALGFVSTSGNTSTRSVNARAALEYRRGHWGNRATVLAFSGTRDGQTTDERYSFANKTDYQLDADNYVFAIGSYDNDRFAGVAERYTLTGGYGRHLLKGPAHRLDLEVGAGANRTRPGDRNRFETSVVGTFGGTYAWVISPNATFSQTLRTEVSESNVYVNPVTSLKLTIVGNLFATFNHEIRYNTEVPADTRHVDQISTINLGYSFGPA